MPRLIDADALVFKDGREYLPTGKYVTIVDINNAPAVDAVPVVRCKDCSLYHKMQDLDEDYDWCDMWDEEIDPNGYCYLGEKE